MANKDTNIYDLMDAVNKNKERSSMSKEKDMNDIFSMLDEIKQDNNISIDEVRQKVNGLKNDSANINDSLQNYSNVVIKPVLPERVKEYDKYSDGVLAYISGVDYGNDNSKEYVKGHKAALEKYYREISGNKNDIFVVEGQVNDEINALSAKDSLYEKGYYDGLFYVLRAIKKVRASIISKLNILLREKLK